MSAATLNLTAEQNATFDLLLTLTDGTNGPPTHLSGAVVKMAISDGYATTGAPLLTLTSDTGNGITVHDSTDHVADPSTIEITITPTQMSTFTVNPGGAPGTVPTKTYVYDLLVEYNGATPPHTDRLVQGTFTVSHGVTTP